MRKPHLTRERIERMQRRAALMRWQTRKRTRRLLAGIKLTDPFYPEWSAAYDNAHPKPVIVP